MVLNGTPIEVSQTGEKMLVELYRRYAGDYPKFFKMDTLSRLGFIAAEILLNGQTANGETANAIDAVILANRSASIKNDTDYLATIAEGNYYPSPALFVYTLPNIVTGEIAIRHHIQGETSFYILDRPEQLEPIIRATIHTAAADREKSSIRRQQIVRGFAEIRNLQIFKSSNLLAGWCECSAADTFYAKLQIIWKN